MVGGRRPHVLARALEVAGLGGSWTSATTFFELILIIPLTAFPPLAWAQYGIMDQVAGPAELPNNTLRRFEETNHFLSEVSGL